MKYKKRVRRLLGRIEDYERMVAIMSPIKVAGYTRPGSVKK